MINNTILDDGYKINHTPEDITGTTDTYPHSKDFTYETFIELIDFDKEREKDLATNKGFIVESTKSIKKDIKAQNGIFSPKFGQTLQDVNPFIDRYKCECGHLRGRINSGMICPECHKRCRYVDDDFSYFGWMVLNDPYMIIHPAFYKKIESFLGKGGSVQGIARTKLDNIIDIADKEDVEKFYKVQKNVKEEPFFGIGMLEFHERFDEIIEFYLNKSKSNQNKVAYYNDIQDHRDMVFTHSIPVFSTLLRPVDIRDGTMSYEPTNALYTMMNKLVGVINKTKTAMQRSPKIKNKQLFNLQKKFMSLYDELSTILSGKKGDFRCLLGGRCNFTSRCVIVQDASLRIDEVTLPITALIIALEQRIKNILHRFYNIQPADAHTEWYNAVLEPNDKIKGIVQSIIDDCKMKGMRGLPVIINRNPTIAYGSILAMYCVGFTDSFSMGVPLQPLPLMCADFDGDVLNILIPINETFIKLIWSKFNPRNVMYISRNDGYFNPSVSMQRDTLINANTFARLGTESYTKDEMDHYDSLMKLSSGN